MYCTSWSNYSNHLYSTILYTCSRANEYRGIPGSSLKGGAVGVSPAASFIAL